MKTLLRSTASVLFVSRAKVLMKLGTLIFIFIFVENNSAEKSLLDTVREFADDQK